MNSVKGDRTDLRDAVGNAVDNDFVVYLDSIYIGWDDADLNFEEVFTHITMKRRLPYSNNSNNNNKKKKIMMLMMKLMVRSFPPPSSSKAL